MQCVLFVDDEVSVLRTLKRLFRKESCRVLTASSGEEGLKILENELVNLVVSDQRMPEMCGSDFLYKVSQRHPYVNRMIMSGFADISAVIDAVNKGSIIRFMTKPWDNDELILTVNNYLKSSVIEHQQQLLKQVLDQQLEIETLRKQIVNA